MGRKAKPTALQKPSILSDPLPVPDAAPPCPKHLDRTAKAKWKQLAEPLYESGLLTIHDQDMLAMYCQAYSVWIKASELLEQNGLIVDSPNGYPQQSPYLNICNAAKKELQSYGSEFGLSPLARTKVKSDKPSAAGQKVIAFLKNRPTPETRA